MGKKKRIGLALGGGAAKGLVHIGVLKVLHKHKIYPDYISGTSMGAVVAALYAAGHSPEELEEIAMTTNWRNMFDFTAPKLGFVKGKVIENKIRKLVNNKQFDELNLPIRLTAYNLTKKEKVIFTKGDVTKAVRASIAIPGVFDPVKIKGDYLVDGGVFNPTPFDIVKEMGADIIIAVDLFEKDKKVKGKKAKKVSFVEELREKFIAVELLNVKNYLFPQRWPKFLFRIFGWIFDKLLYPAKILRIMSGRELPEIGKILYSTVEVLTNNLAKERLRKSNVDIKVTPTFEGISWTDFDRVDEFIKLGEKEMEKHISKLKKLI